MISYKLIYPNHIICKYYVTNTINEPYIVYIVIYCIEIYCINKYNIYIRIIYISNLDFEKKNNIFI